MYNGTLYVESVIEKTIFAESIMKETLYVESLIKKTPLGGVDHGRNTFCGVYNGNTLSLLSVMDETVSEEVFFVDTFKQR